MASLTSINETPGSNTSQLQYWNNSQLNRIPLLLRSFFLPHTPTLASYVQMNMWSCGRRPRASRHIHHLGDQTSDNVSCVLQEQASRDEVYLPVTGSWRAWALQPWWWVDQIISVTHVNTQKRFDIAKMHLAWSDQLQPSDFHQKQKTHHWSGECSATECTTSTDCPPSVEHAIQSPDRDSNNLFAIISKANAVSSHTWHKAWHLSKTQRTKLTVEQCRNLVNIKYTYIRLLVA